MQAMPSFFIETHFKLIVEIVLLISIFLTLIYRTILYTSYFDSLFNINWNFIFFTKNKLRKNGKLKIVHENNIYRILISSMHGIKEVKS